VEHFCDIDTVRKQGSRNGGTNTAEHFNDIDTARKQERTSASSKQQAASSKQQAASSKQQATSSKHDNARGIGNAPGCTWCTT